MIIFFKFDYSNFTNQDQEENGCGWNFEQQCCQEQWRAFRPSTSQQCYRNNLMSSLSSQVKSYIDFDF